MSGGLDSEALLSLQRAVDFSVLDANPTWSQEIAAGSWLSWKVMTTDNSEIQIWPIDTGHGFVALETGAIVRTLAGGYQIGEDLHVTPPSELRIPLAGVSLDQQLISSIHQVVSGKDDKIEGDDGRRVGQAIGWLSKAWRNTTSIMHTDRLIFLKTGFEALTGDSSTPGAGRRLRELFEAGVDSDLGDADILWSQTEAENWTYLNGKGKEVGGTDLEHWFHSFGRARNAIIHGDVVPPELSYNKAGSAYNGPMFHTADRLLREAIKVRLSMPGRPQLYRSPVVRAVARRLQDALPADPAPER